MEDDCFRDSFGIESTVSMIGDKKPKVLKVAKQAGDRICGISDIWSIGCEANCNIVRWE